MEKTTISNLVALGKPISLPEESKTIVKKKNALETFSRGSIWTIWMEPFTPHRGKSFQSLTVNIFPDWLRERW